VLVVDDSVDSAETLAMLVELAGHQCRLAHSGREALEVAASFRPDLVILDIGLPDMSGHQVARQLRNSPATRTATLVALSGFGTDSDRRASAEAGFDDHVVKPPELAEIERLLYGPRK
jgi:CheY-like chemotaxis protein